MSENPPILLKPTPWFLWRATAILMMFLIFSVLFYKDGSTGYREKNEAFYLKKAFDDATDEFSALSTTPGFGPESWRSHAQKQTVKLPDDPYVLPRDLKQPLPWPEILHDYDRVKPLQWQKLWLEYSAQMGYPADPPEEAYDRRKIQEQWVVLGVCLALATLSLFFLIRTARRSISADDQGITGPQGKRVAYQDIRQLDLRKWETKGIASVRYDGPSGKGSLRIDGLTYGGFKKEQNQPAEQLMQRIRANFSGELIEYTRVANDVDDGNDPNPA